MSLSVFGAASTDSLAVGRTGVSLLLSLLALVDTGIPTARFGGTFETSVTVPLRLVCLDG